MHPLQSLNARRTLTLLLCVLSNFAWAAKLPDVVVTGDPVAPSPDQSGTGLCVANSVSTDPAADFPQSTSSYIAGMNEFMERTAASRTNYVLRKSFDLSNNNTGGTQASRGDFVDAVQGCTSYGCSFFVNDPFTSFGSRFRGYLNVTPDMANQALHFGFYVDDAVSLVIFDRNNVQYQVINRPPQLGAPTWRTTNSITFQRTGLYPVEILFAEVSEHAALELALLDGTFTDFERTANQTPIVKLNDSGFLLVPPEKFFQTETGRPSFPDDPGTPQDELSQCQQCNRANANAPGNGGCGMNSGYYCNGAAVCAPCDTARFCGSSCLPCGASAPHCINSNGSYTCVECTADTQCSNGRCDPETHTCTGCNDNEDCPGGMVCNLPTFTCVQCTTDSQCPDGRCDLATHTCMGCNADSQCSNGRVCHVPSGTCVECTATNHCPNSRVCNPSTLTCVECITNGQCPNGRVCDPSTFTCVQCTTDSQCPDGRCDLATRTCTGCNASSQCSNGRACHVPTGTCVECNAEGQCPIGKVCNLSTFTCVECNANNQCPSGKVCNLPTFTCVECNANSQCPNGKVCNLPTFTCVECIRNEDCSPTQVCSLELKQCRACTPADGCNDDEPEPKPPGSGCGCGTSDSASHAFLSALLAALFFFRLLRPRRP